MDVTDGDTYDVKRSSGGQYISGKSVRVEIVQTGAYGSGCLPELQRRAGNTVHPGEPHAKQSSPLWRAQDVL